MEEHDLEPQLGIWQGMFFVQKNSLKSVQFG